MKRALVTGASGDIGAAIAERLAADGLMVYVHAHLGIDRAQAVAERIRQAGGAAETLAFDVCDPDASRAAIAGILSAGPIQVLVNNAGIHDDVPLPGMSLARWRSVIDVALLGFYNCTQPLLMPMIRERWGRIVSVTSVAAVTGNRGQTNYAAAKAGVHGATKSLALELASRGITVNAIAPGIVASRMTAGAFDQATIKRLVPMGRAGRPEEVADLVAYLVCGDSGYLSGQIINLNGAMI
jgi:3-oxoacyl-[acyl-carrier protein] reductase